MSNVHALEKTHSSQLEIITTKVSEAPVKFVLDRVPVLVEAQAENNFELGGYLSRVRDGKLMPDGTSFNGWLETQGIKPARGNQLAQVFEAIVACDLPKDTLERVQWSKLCLIASRLQSGTGDEALKNNNMWIGTAEMLSQKMLREALASGKEKPSEPKSVQHVIKLPTDKEETYQSAIKHAKKALKVKTEVEAITEIAADYLAAKNGKVTLISIMKANKPEDVFALFTELWPDFDFQAFL